MKILVDANIFLSVILNEPEKQNIIDITRDAELISPEVLPYEICNALSAMFKRKRINKEQIIKCYSFFSQIPVRLVEVNLVKALTIASEHEIYAYDAYYLETAKRMKLNLFSLDQKMKNVAQSMNITIMEV